MNPLMRAAAAEILAESYLGAPLKSLVRASISKLEMVDRLNAQAELMKQAGMAIDAIVKFTVSEFITGKVVHPLFIECFFEVAQRRGFNINSPVDDEGNYLAHIIADLGQKFLLPPMREWKVRMDVLNNDGKTPLELAHESQKWQPQDIKDIRAWMRRDIDEATLQLIRSEAINRLKMEVQGNSVLTVPVKPMGITGASPQMLNFQRA